MSKQPFLPLFFGDFLASTAEWTGEERSLYLTLLGYQWSLGSLPAEPDKVRRVVQWDRKLFASCWPTVATKFIEQDGRMVNVRLEQHREKSNDLAEKNRASGIKGAAARWGVNGDRHRSANGEDIATAIEAPKRRHRSANGVTHSNPSHPIPSEDSEGASKPRRASRRCPKTFEPDREFALREIPDLDVDREVQKFRDWEFKTPRSDWPAAWRTWIGNCRDRGSYAKSATSPGAIQWQ